MLEAKRGATRDLVINEGADQAAVAVDEADSADALALLHLLRREPLLVVTPNTAEHRLVGIQQLLNLKASVVMHGRLGHAPTL